MSLEDVKGVGAVTAEKLRQAGIISPTQLSVLRPDEVKALGIVNSIKAAKETINSALDLAYRDVRIYTGSEYKAHLLETRRYINTGSNVLDEYFGGGWLSRSTNGLFGLGASGKTQFCNTAIVFCVDMGLHVLVVETETNTFDIDRLANIAKERGLDWNPELIHIYPATNVGTVFGQFRGYMFLEREATEKEYDVGLIVIDSFNAKFRRAYAGREMYPARSQEFGRHIDYVEEMCKKFNASVLLTFQCGVTPDPGGERGNQMKYHGKFYPVGGTLVLHNVNTWLSLQQKSGGEQSTKSYHGSITDHNFLPSKNFNFVIDEYGVRDL